jgi:hypothetical protein
MADHRGGRCRGGGRARALDFLLPVRGKGSGVVVDQRVFTVVALRHKKLTQIDDFSERSQALDAAGLRE